MDCKPWMDPTLMKNLIFKSQIPPWREIWSKSPRSHPKEKSGQRAPDPTPKRNLVKEPRIPPRREIWSKSPRIPPQRKFRVGELEIQKLVIKLLPPPTTTTTTLTVLGPDGFAAGKKDLRLPKKSSEWKRSADVSTSFQRRKPKVIMKVRNPSFPPLDPAAIGRVRRGTEWRRTPFPERGV